MCVRWPPLWLYIAAVLAMTPEVVRAAAASKPAVITIVNSTDATPLVYNSSVTYVAVLLRFCEAPFLPTLRFAVTDFAASATAKLAKSRSVTLVLFNVCAPNQNIIIDALQRITDG